MARTRIGWAMAASSGSSPYAYAVFGWFSLLWRENGYSPGQAGALVGLVAAVSIPLSVGPGQWPGARGPRRLVLAIMLCFPAGYLGLMVAPHSLAVLWALLVGIGAVTFPIADLHRTALAHAGEHRRAVGGSPSRWATCWPAVGPFGVGTLNDLTGGWTAPLLLVGVTVPQIWLGLYSAVRGASRIRCEQLTHHERGGGLEAATGVERHRPGARAEHHPGEAAFSRRTPCTSRTAGRRARCCGAAVARSSSRGSPTGPRRRRAAASRA